MRHFSIGITECSVDWFLDGRTPTQVTAGNQSEKRELVSVQSRVRIKPRDHRLLLLLLMAFVYMGEILTQGQKTSFCRRRICDYVRKIGLSRREVAMSVEYEAD